MTKLNPAGVYDVTTGNDWGKPLIRRFLHAPIRVDKPAKALYRIGGVEQQESTRREFWRAFLGSRMFTEQMKPTISNWFTLTLFSYFGRLNLPEPQSRSASKYLILLMGLAPGINRIQRHLRGRFLDEKKARQFLDKFSSCKNNLTERWYVCAEEGKRCAIDNWCEERKREWEYGVRAGNERRVRCVINSKTATTQIIRAHPCLPVEEIFNRLDTYAREYIANFDRELMYGSIDSNPTEFQGLQRRLTRNPRRSSDMADAFIMSFNQRGMTATEVLLRREEAKRNSRR